MDYSETINKQRDYFDTHRTYDISFRTSQLKKFRSILQQQETALYEAIYKDFKKSIFEMYGSELSFVYHEIDLAIKKLPQWTAKKKVKTNLMNIPGRSYIMPEPLGVCLVIGAWNYPYMLSLLPVVSAMAAGNTVIIKPSEIPSATSSAMAKLINENFPSNYLTVVEGGVEETTALLSQKFDKIFFTGSTAVGKIIYQAAAKFLTPVTLELGGKSPAIVTARSNIRGAAKRIAWGKFLNAGQSCVSPDYVVVDENVKDELLSFLKEYVVKFDYSFDNDNYVQIINDRNFQRLTGLIDKNKIYYGGETDPESRYIAPTILKDVTFDDAVMENEIFGPILPVIAYSNLNETLRKIKSRSKPLACYVFTNDHKEREKILGDISFGGGAVNDTMMHLSNGNLPFGGVGESGTGNYHGEYGFNAFSHFKSIIEKPFWGETQIKYPPYSGTKLRWLKRFLGS